MCSALGRPLLFQFALPYGERPMNNINASTAELVSIRAPAWGATFETFRPAIAAKVSIRAPAWGATYPALLRIACLVVSIRAPA